MTEFRGYVLIENLGLTDAQRATLIEGIMALGVRNDSLFPNERNHWAIRPDNQAAIFEAVFDADSISVVGIRDRLANLFGVPVTSITYNIIQTIYGPLVVYKYLSVNKLRAGIFGGLTATWAESHAAALLYLSDYKDLWGGTELP